MNILVTGGAGFIGTNLIKFLLEKNHTVYSLDDYSTGLHSNEIPGCKYISGDLSDIDTIQNDIDIVYHLAARARIQPSFEHPEEYIRTNFEGTYAVIRYCIKNNIPLIYAGSSSKHNGKFKNPYTFSKDLGEEIIQLYQEHYGLKATITRFYNVYGPHQLLEGGYTTLIGRWINNIKKKEQCYIYGNGEQRRDFTHVSDIVNALILIMEKQAYSYEFELGRGKNYSVNEVAQMLDIKPIYQPAKKGEANITLNTSTLAQEILDWKPNYNLEDYIRLTKHENNL
jgi:UDP-glucose 4-epimerase